ncbi:hypothetical protein CONLIGDRAFT_620305 [Coniochaeta ligniaria NRRL 30616]|uniref:Helicase ATP-binding domain-containing protein n=1 Tax=Coniochaeta ligniaria NRRL 30616 TaxID=1408157 RepID=A0A1J7IZG2_9PEZI|nr:hypothetical protein CONLIGDRAFT_620305 [Coniochaeta ligniaria NRRL 30616]
MATQAPAKRRRLSPSASLQFLPPHVPRGIDTSYCVDQIFHPDDSQLAQSTEPPIVELGGERETVCFGAILGINCVIDGVSSYLAASENAVPVILISADSFSGAKHQSFQGKVDTAFLHITNALLEEKNLELQVHCIRTEPLLLLARNSIAKRPSHAPPQSVNCSLSITMYGPMELFDEVGDFFEANDIFIQDPKGCNREVRYCNPHRLSSLNLDGSTWTSQFDGNVDLADMKDVTTGPELLDLLDSQSNLAETSQPSAIATILERHQKQALTFMLQRERGWMFEAEKADLWDIADTGRGRFFINRVSDAHQHEEPDQFYGGIIADPMGFGKTLTMIALIAIETPTILWDLSSSHSPEVIVESPDSTLPQTLIIVPPPLLETWEEQLSDHVVLGCLNWRRHHGTVRLNGQSDLHGVNIVLTTYHTVAADWKNHASRGTSVLFTSRWRRLVLDEAHVIRNSNSQMAKALCALNAMCRWAVTGTPIQNRLKDFSALLKFLQVYPYNDQRKFDNDISNLWKGGEVDEAIKRLKRLSGCLLLRRPQGTVKLPPRKDLQCTVTFTSAERELYDSIRHRAIQHIDEVKFGPTDASGSSAYINVLQQIEAMRMVCNLGLHYHSRHNASKTAWNPAPSTRQDWSATAQRIFNLHRTMALIQCHYCSSPVEDVERLFADDEQTQAQFSRCLRFTCADCTQTQILRTGHCDCDHDPACPLAPVSTIVAGMEETGLLSMIGNFRPSPPGQLPTKVATLVTQLMTLPLGVKSLTLTVASRAYLLEPHWNPTLEEQALARIHRMGQKQEVTTVRFCVRDTFEEATYPHHVLRHTDADIQGIARDRNPRSQKDAGQLDIRPS